MTTMMTPRMAKKMSYPFCFEVVNGENDDECVHLISFISKRRHHLQSSQYYAIGNNFDGHFFKIYY